MTVQEIFQAKFNEPIYVDDRGHVWSESGDYEVDCGDGIYLVRCCKRCGTSIGAGYADPEAARRCTGE